MGAEVVVPAWMIRVAAVGGEDGIAAVEREVHQRIHALGSTPRAPAVEQEERSALEMAANPSVVGAELVDDLLVPLALRGHASE